MGKATGFLDYKRVDRPIAPPEERVKSFRDLHGALPAAERREQGGRCMSCGVPFCQSDFGCPLNNLIPEWNDDVFGGNWEHAVGRLLKTNDFPEFTGRVCPALCETACTCGLNGEAVSVRDNELTLIEYAFEKGLMQPRVPAVRSGKRVAVVGSGPAGLAAANRLNQRGHDVTVFERDERPGGLLMYGIPNMKLEKSVIERRVKLMEAEGIRFICGADVGGAISGEALTSEYDAVILACGARKARALGAEGEDMPGVYPALDYLTESTRAVLDGRESAISAQGLDVIVIGNGDTATDCAATAVRQGAKSVTQLVRKPKREAAPRVWPHAAAGEKTDYGQEECAAAYGRDPRLYETTVRRLIAGEDGRLAAIEALSAGQSIELPCAMLIVAAGFSGAAEQSAAAFGISLNDRGWAGLADAPYRTERERVFVCGDMRRGATLVATAIAEGRACARAVDAYLEGYSNM